VGRASLTTPKLRRRVLTFPPALPMRNHASDSFGGGGCIPPYCSAASSADCASPRPGRLPSPSCGLGRMAVELKQLCTFNGSSLIHDFLILGRTDVPIGDAIRHQRGLAIYEPSQRSRGIHSSDADVCSHRQASWCPELKGSSRVPERTPKNLSISMQRVVLIVLTCQVTTFVVVLNIRLVADQSFFVGR
jgi:hypothetical protein